MLNLGALCAKPLRALRLKKININNLDLLKIKRSIIILLFTIPVIGFSQETKLPERITEIAEELAYDEGDAGAAEIFSDWLYDLSENPVSINSGDEKEISRLFFLNDFQVKILADYVRTSGRIVTPYEIANIPGFDRESAEMLIPFITLENNLPAFVDSARLRQALLANFSYKTAEKDPSFLGSQWKILSKYRISFGRFSGGFTIEKDPGEKFLSGSPSLPDFLSGHLAFNGRGIIKRIIIGDFSARIGQGTSINTGMRAGLSLTSPGYMAARNEIRPYTSADENNYFRGAAANLSTRNLELLLFISSNKIDATLNDSANSTSLSIRSLYKTGLHTSSSSLSKKDNVNEINCGVNLSCNFKNFRTGFALTGIRLSIPVMPDMSGPFDKNDFTGIKNTLLTVYYSGLLKRAIFYGELSGSEINKYAFIQGISFRPSDRLSINLLYRNYSPGYVSFHGNGPSGSSRNNNEYGILGNLTFETARHLFISAGSDIRYYPWLKYRCSSPSLGKRHEIRVKYLPTQKLSFEAIYNYRYAIVDDMQENKIPGQEETVTKSIRGSARYSPSEYLTLITRCDYKVVSPSGSKGILLLQDVNIRLKRLPVSIWIRYCIYNTGGFDSGIYTWENDLMNSFSVPVLYGDGNRGYIMASWRLARRIDLRIKYSTTATSIINNRMNEVSEIKIQIRINI